MNLKRLPEFKKIVPTIAVLFMRGDIAIAQTTQPSTPLPPVQTPDPLTSYGVAVAVLVSLGNVAVTIFKNYATNLGKRSEIELKKEESEQQRNQDIAVMVMHQQEALVQHLQKAQQESSQELIKLLHESNEAQHKMAAAIESLTKEIKRSKI
jgi:hypothetical protein